MAATIMETSANIPSSEAKELLGIEVKALREAAEKSTDPGMLLFLDFMEAGQDHWNLLLELALKLSARQAADGGLSQRQWMQQLLSRHASDRNRVETLWRTLVGLLERGQLPWTA